MSPKLEKVSVLVRKANLDYITAEKLIGDDDCDLYCDIISFHCQQCMEKYLKAFLMYNEVNFPKSHDLRLLVNLCVKADSDFEKFDVAEFSHFGVSIRYDDIVSTIDITQRAFKIAKIIMDGEFTEGVGGGVCQVSTTLYNAAVRADLNITHVASHSLPISYAAPSFDAMVSSQCDLTFNNDGKMPVFIKCFSKGDRAIVEIYGTPLPYVIRPKSVITGSLEPPPSDEIIDFAGQYTTELESGARVPIKPAKQGLKSEGYLYYYNNRGVLVNKKRVRRDSYKGIKGLYAIAP